MSLLIILYFPAAVEEQKIDRQVRRVGRSANLKTVENMADIVPADIERGCVGVFQKRKKLSTKKRKLADKKVKRKKTES